MKHLTIEDFRLILDTPNTPCPDDLAEHLNGCDLCAASYEIFSAPVAVGSEAAGDAGCPFGDGVYELFRDRLPSERLPLLGHHLLICEQCGEFFDLLAGKEKALPMRVKQLESWLEAAREAKAAITPYQIVNEYALAASGDAKVIEAYGKLRGGAEFSIAYYPDKTIFKMKKADAANLSVKVYSDERWVEGWDELDEAHLGFELPSNSVSNIHLAAPDDEIGETILTMPYELLK